MARTYCKRSITINDANPITTLALLPIGSDASDGHKVTTPAFSRATTTRQATSGPEGLLPKQSSPEVLCPSEVLA